MTDEPQFEFEVDGEEINFEGICTLAIGALISLDGHFSGAADAFRLLLDKDDEEVSNYEYAILSLKGAELVEADDIIKRDLLLRARSLRPREG